MVNKKNAVLSVRMDVLTYDELVKYAKKNGYSQAKIVEGLIKYFIGLKEAEQRLLVTGRGFNHLVLLGEALHLVNWGDHAFRGYYNSRGTLASRGSFLPWVIEIYNKLNKIAASVYGEDTGDSAAEVEGAVSLRRIAWFKLGAAWIQVAIALRTQALIDLGGLLIDKKSSKSVAKPPDWVKLYDKATQSLRIAIANYHLFNQSLKKSGKHPTVLYNQACAWSLIAQYLGEKDASIEKLKPFAVRTYEDEEEKSKKQKSEECLVSKENPDTEKALRKANSCLNDITLLYTGEVGGVPFVDSQWLFDYAIADPDIACFREAEDKAFKRWLSKREDRISLLSFRHEIPLDIEEVLVSPVFD